MFHSVGVLTQLAFDVRFAQSCSTVLGFLCNLPDTVVSCVQLFSKGGQEADSGVRAASKPAAIKHDVKLAGFGAAARLSGQGYAIQPSPYRSALILMEVDVVESPTGRHSCTCAQM